jgi:nucleotide-binding universal stress UspA family protein
MFHSILVPLDGSGFGEHALPLAASLARRTGATLHLVHVHQPIPPTTVAGVAVMTTVDLHLRQDEQAYLADVTRRLHEKGPLEVRTSVVEGDVIAALREEVARREADLVVMSTHGRGALGRFWLGGVADALVRGLCDPLLLVRPGDGAADLKREPNLRNVLVALDGTPLSEQALARIEPLAQLVEATVHLVRVVRPVLRPAYLPDATSAQGLASTALDVVAHAQKHALDEAQAYLDAVAARLRPKGLNVQARVVLDESPAAAILREAQARNADLIALATHGRSGLSRLVLGSVTDKVLRGATVPVLVQRPAAPER